MNGRNTKLTGKLAWMAAVPLLWATGCGLGSGNSKAGVTATSGPSISGTTHPLSSEALMAHYEAATGVSRTAGNNSTSIPNSMSVEQNFLPKMGNMSELSMSGVLSQTHLAGVFCYNLIQNEMNTPAANRRFLAGVDFTKNNISFTTAARIGFVEALAGKAWSRVMTADEVTAFTAFLVDVDSGTSASTTVTFGVALAGCTATLSAPAATSL